MGRICQASRPHIVSSHWWVWAICVFASLTEKHCFTSWLMVALTSRVISQKFRTLLMLTLSPATSVLASVVWAGHVIYMASIVGRLTGWHRLCCVPVDFTDWLPDGRKVLSSDFKSADISILLPTHTPPRVSSLFFYFPTLHPLFFLLLLPPNLSD